MSEQLPREIDPLRLADEGIRIRGELPGDVFLRLQEQAQSGTRPEPVRIDLQFERTTHGVRLLHGTIQARIVTACQRCLGPVTLTLTAKPLLAIVAAGEAADGVPDDAETLTVEAPVRLVELVEDELLLVMPMIPLHDEGDCTAPGAGDGRKAETHNADKSSPFAALRKMKTRE